MPESRNVEELIAHLRRQGHRITIQRRLVLEVLAEEEGHRHYTGEEIHRRLSERGAGVDMATVYRILHWLRDLGIVSQTDVGTGCYVYSLAYPPHHHLICLNCGHTFTIDDEPFEGLRRMLKEKYGFVARIEHFAIFGYCDDCSVRASNDSLTEGQPVENPRISCGKPSESEDNSSAE